MAELRDAFLAAMRQRRRGNDGPHRQPPDGSGGTTEEASGDPGDDDAAESLFVEVTLIDGVNDSVHEAKRLVEFLRPFGPRGCKVNLIPYNGRCTLGGLFALLVVLKKGGVGIVCLSVCAERN